MNYENSNIDTVDEDILIPDSEIKEVEDEKEEEIGNILEDKE